LLVDADGRMGCLERLFGMSSGPGLAEVLQGRISLQEAVVPTGWENVDLLPRGQSGCPSGEIFHLQPKVLEAAALEYAMVLLDSPPVLAADDSATIAPLVEGVVFVMRAGKTSARVARGALGCLYQRQANVLGLVLNGVSVGGGEWVRFHGYEEYGRVLKVTGG
jgi:polysaccharide biosynthesis transport protein